MLRAARRAAILITVLGVMWMETGVLSRCSIHCLIGYSTSPVNGAAKSILDLASPLELSS